jgi:hydrogenase maturation protease
VIRIIGIGNPLMGDDGVGIAVVERLQEETLPAGVEVLDGGTGGLALLDLMAGVERVILVDAVETGRPPGAVIRLAGTDLMLPEQAPAFSLHETALPSVFALGRELGVLPSAVVLFGVQPHSVEWRLGLSPAVAAAVAEVVGRVLAEASAVQEQ